MGLDFNIRSRHAECANFFLISFTINDFAERSSKQNHTFPNNVIFRETNRFCIRFYFEVITVLQSNSHVSWLNEFSDEFRFRSLASRLICVMSEARAADISQSSAGSRDISRAEIARYKRGSPQPATTPGMSRSRSPFGGFVLATALVSWHNCYNRLAAPFINKVIKPGETRFFVQLRFTTLKVRKNW